MVVHLVVVVACTLVPTFLRPPQERLIALAVSYKGYFRDFSFPPPMPERSNFASLAPLLPERHAAMQSVYANPWGRFHFNL